MPKGVPRAIPEYMWLVIARGGRSHGTPYARGDVVQAIPNRGPGWLVPAEPIPRNVKHGRSGFLVRVHGIPSRYASLLVQPLRHRERGIIAPRRWRLDLDSIPKAGTDALAERTEWQTTYLQIKRHLTAKRGPGRDGPPIYLFGRSHDELMARRAKEYA